MSAHSSIIYNSQKVVKIYYNKRIQSKISKGKRWMGQSSEETRHKLPMVFSQWSHTRMSLDAPTINYDKTCSILSTRSSLEMQCLRFLLRTGPVGTLCYAWYQDSRLPEEMKVININHIVQLKQSKPFLLVRKWCESPQIQVLGCQPRPNLVNRTF